MEPLVVYQIVSLTIFAVGAAAAAAVVILSIIALIRRCKKRILPVYLIAGALYAVAMARDFLHAFSPVACSRFPASTLLGAGVLLLLHLYFLWDILRCILGKDLDKDAP